MVKEIITNKSELSFKCVLATALEPDYMMTVIADLLDTARAHNNCAGLAANQLGYHARILVIKYDGRYKVIIDPEYLRKWGGKSTKKEGCLSVPGTITKPVRVSRYKRVKIKYFDLDEKRWVERNFSNTNARVIQHEMDHLDGVLIG